MEDFKFWGAIDSIFYLIDPRWLNFLQASILHHHETSSNTTVEATTSHRRQDSVDALSFGTFRSRDKSESSSGSSSGSDSDSDNRKKLSKRKTVVDLPGVNDLVRGSCDLSIR